MNEKLKPEHLQRAAYVYVRQSTNYQVRHHREGQQRQYDLAQRARQLGFRQVIVLDEDLGRSGSGLQERPGFGRLLAAVCQGLAGAVLALEASRLARNNRDWHHLVDLCALTGTLLIDDEGTYDPKVLNDRLLLGLKGTMSEFELGLMRQRARQAYLQKVKRGEAMWEVPTGFVRSKEGQIEKTPDRQVQQAIEMVLAKFRQLYSARQTLIWLREEKLRLPMAQPGTAGQEIHWGPPTLSRVHQILRNPCYAGAFAFGRTATKMIISEGRVRRSPSRQYRPQAEWEVLIIEHHAGYISWTEYLENRQTMAKNVARRQTEQSGAIKKGPALLSGLLRCGRCGRKLQVGYSGSHGEVGRYLCCGRREEHGSGSCFSMGRLKVDQMVVEQVLEAIAPGGIEAAIQASQLSAQAAQEKRTALRLALEKAQYEVQRAKRQYDLVDPENRLVASELETRWNSALQNVAELKARLEALPEAPSLTGDQKQRLLELGADLPHLWNDPQTPIELKKQILLSRADGGWQRLDAVSLPQWSRTSAMLRGESVDLELVVAPGESGIFAQVTNLVVGERVGVGARPKSLCTPLVDHRVAANDPRVGRIWSSPEIGYGTAFLVSNGAVLTAGHMFNWNTNTGSFDALAGVFEVNVPPSDPDGTPNPASPDDEYPVDPTGQVVSNYKNDNCGDILNSDFCLRGDDYGLFRLLPNSNNGDRAHETHGFFRLSAQELAVNSTVRVTGYGIDYTPLGTSGTNNAQSLTEQTATGVFLGMVTNKVLFSDMSAAQAVAVRHRVDTTSGDSGGPIIREDTGYVIGIHTLSGCTDILTYNGGTSFAIPTSKCRVFSDLNNYGGAVHVDSGHISVVQNGTLFDPFHSLMPVDDQEYSGAVVSIVVGAYPASAGNAPLTIGAYAKNLTLTAPVGMVTIGN